MLLIAALSAAALEAGPAPAVPEAAPTEVSCVDLRRTGSMLPHRVCRTAAEWARLRATRADICGPAVTSARQHCDVQLTSEGEQVTVRTR